VFYTHFSNNRSQLIDKKDILLPCIKALLKPVTKFCLKNSIRIQDLNESIKQSLISVATEKLDKENIKPTISRLSVMTGIHRRDVVRIFKNQEIRPIGGGLIHRIIGLWEQHDKYRGDNGLPRKLSIASSNNEFKELILSLSQDVDASTIMFELIRVGAVKQEEDSLILLVDAYASDQNPLEAYQMLSQDLSDLHEAVEENVWDDLKTPNLHAKTEYVNISAQDLPRIRQWLLEKGSEFHRNTRDYLSRFDRDINPQMRAGKKARVVLGTFSRITEDGEEE